MTPAPPSPARGAAQVAISGLCPRCGSPGLFVGMVQFADRCKSCGLSYAGFNVGDGPAAFLTFGIGAVITGCAIWLELAVAPPFWVHLLLWVPLATVGVIGSLRLAKGLLLALEYANAAREGRVTPAQEDQPAP